MSHDTQDINKQRVDLDALDEIWLFGYGSLIYKVDFPILEQRDAYITGWSRRFWQGSHDHRGTPDSPGRVLTLIEAPNERCDGVAYKITHDEFDHLDHREKNGYLRHQVNIHFTNGEHRLGVIYIADEENDAFLGRLPESEIAKQIANSHGPSGSNKEYVYKLTDALLAKGMSDSHVFAIFEQLKELDKQPD